MPFFDAGGARIVPVTPYCYATDRESASVADAIKKMAAGEIDIGAFTSSPQIRRLLDVAALKGLEQELASRWYDGILSA
ncbi:MAG: hypothetical protein WCA81_08090 [Rhizomicrobium sp.]